MSRALTPPRTKAAIPEKVLPSRDILEIAASIARKHLSLGLVATRSGINYHTLSAMLNGRVTRPKHLPALRRAVASFPTP